MDDGVGRRAGPADHAENEDLISGHLVTSLLTSGPRLMTAARVLPRLPPYPKVLRVQGPEVLSGSHAQRFLFGMRPTGPSRSTLPASVAHWGRGTAPTRPDSHSRNVGRDSRARIRLPRHPGHRPERGGDRPGAESGWSEPRNRVQ
jgi:hypothetical protein